MRRVGLFACCTSGLGNQDRLRGGDLAVDEWLGRETGHNVAESNDRPQMGSERLEQVDARGSGVTC